MVDLSHSQESLSLSQRSTKASREPAESKMMAPLSASECVLGLTGLLSPLSNYFVLPFTVRSEKFRSVEHYVKTKMIRQLNLGKCEEAIRTTVDPYDVRLVFDRLVSKRKVSEEDLAAVSRKAEKWLISALKAKITEREDLEHLLLATGNAILVETANSEDTTDVEYRMQKELTKQHTNANAILGIMRGASEQNNVTDQNMGAVLLMQLRAKIAGKKPLRRIPLCEPIDEESTKLLKSCVSSHLLCFTAASILHPFYQLEIEEDGKTYPSPAHYIVERAVKTLGITEENNKWIFEGKLGIHVWNRLYMAIDCQQVSYRNLRKWFVVQRQVDIKEALRLMFQRHTEVRRALLETGDALLVYCSRFTTVESELTCGMRERDLRLFLRAYKWGTRELLTIFTYPMAFRPDAMGGNRLGIILMELRREFMLEGMYPGELPDSGLSPSIILGTSSVTENFCADKEFVATNRCNFTELWLNPFFEHAKRNPANFQLWKQASVVALPWRLVPLGQSVQKKKKVGKPNHSMSDTTISTVNISNSSSTECRSPVSTMRKAYNDLSMDLRKGRRKIAGLDIEISTLKNELNHIRDQIAECVKLKNEENRKPLTLADYGGYYRSGRSHKRIYSLPETQSDERSASRCSDESSSKRSRWELSVVEEGKPNESTESTAAEQIEQFGELRDEDEGIF